MKSKLAQQIAVDVAVVIFGGMLVYATYQFLTGVAGPIELILRHLWHSAALGILVYGFLLLRLRSRVLRPLDLLFFHAKDVSRGVFEKCNYPETQNEIDQVTTMMNQMATHLHTIKQTSWKDYAEVIERHLDRIRQQETLPMQVQDELLEIRDTLRKMELTIIGFEEAPAPIIKSYGKGQGNSTIPRGFLNRGNKIAV